MPTSRIKLTKEQFDSGQLPFPNNHVIVDVSYSNEGTKTKGGIIVGFDKDITYSAGDDAHAADLQEVYGTVVRVPDKLYFDKDDNKSMSYETDMELQVGDKVWFGIIESANCHELEVEDKIYKILPYEDIYCAKRGDKVIVLNGYCLCQTVNQLKISELDVISESKIDTTRCVVKYVGKPNRLYKEPSYVDHPDLREGDTVLLAPRTPLMFLERKKYMANFDGDELYIVVPRRKVTLVLSRG